METTRDTGRLGTIRGIAERVARPRGLEVFDVQFRREAHGWVLRIVLDKPGAPVHAGRAGTVAGEGVTIDDCQFVSTEVGTLLDVEDAVGHRYTLEVSSPGLDRPLRGPDDYRRFRGRLAHLVLSSPVDGRGDLTGRIDGSEGGMVRLLLDGSGGLWLPLAQVKKARLVVEVAKGTTKKQ